MSKKLRNKNFMKIRLKTMNLTDKHKKILTIISIPLLPVLIPLFIICCGFYIIYCLTFDFLWNRESDV